MAQGHPEACRVLLPAAGEAALPSGGGIQQESRANESSVPQCTGHPAQDSCPRRGFPWQLRQLPSQEQGQRDPFLLGYSGQMSLAGSKPGKGLSGWHSEQAKGEWLPPPPSAPISAPASPPGVRSHCSAVRHTRLPPNEFQSSPYGSPWAIRPERLFPVSSRVRRCLA